jgi:hypothetical protein
MNRMGRERDYGTIARWITVISSGVLLVVVVLAVSRFGGRSSDLSAASVERAIHSSVVQCYALEGSYPPSLEYLEKNYGLLLDRTRYAFLYEVPGANLAPIVGVTVR